jgi:hypothetical protein
VELLAVAVVSGTGLLILDRRAGHDSDQVVARYVEKFSPNTIAAVFVGVAGLTFLEKAGGGLYWLIPATMASLAGGDRRRPVTGVPCAAAAAPSGLRPKDAAKLPPGNGETPGGPWPPTAGHPGRSFPLDCSRAWLFTAGTVRPGAPKVRP